MHGRAEVDEVVGEQLAAGQLQQDGEEVLVVGGRILVHRGQGVDQQADGLVVGVDPAGSVRGVDRCAPGLRGVLGTGREPVPGDLALVPRPAGQHLGDACVHPCATTAGEGGVRRVAHQGVREPEAVHPELAHQSGLQGGVETIEHLVLVGPQRGRQRGHVEVAPHHARDPQRRRGLLGQAPEASGEHVLDGGGRVLLVQQGGEVAALTGEAGVLHQEERVAVGAGTERVGLRRGGGRGRDRRDDLPRLRGAQPGELEPQRVPTGQHLGELGELARGWRLGPPRGEDHQPSGLGGLGEQAQHPQRRGVGPVQVVEDHQEVLVHRRVQHGAGDGLPRPEAGGALTRALRRPRRELVAEVAEHAGPGIERWRALVLGAPADEHPDSLGGRRGRQLRAQPALADAGFACDHGEDRTVVGLLEQPDQGRELVVPADQRPRELTWPRRRRSVLRDRSRRRPLQGRVLTQHRGLQGTQLGPGLDAQLVGQQLTHLPEHLERVRLAPGPGQGQRAQPPQAFAQRVRRGQHLELAGHHRVSPETQGGHGAVLERDRPQLLQPGPLRLRGGSVLELGVGQPAPQRERVVQRGEQLLEPLCRRPGRHSRPQQSRPQPVVGRAHGRLEPCGVEGLLRQEQGVARLLGDQHLRRRARWPVGLERTPQPGDVPLQRGGDRGWRVLAPEQIDERVLAHRLSPAHGERGEQRALLARAEVDRGPVEPGLGGSQDADAHVRRIGRSGGPGDGLADLWPGAT